MIPSDEEKNSKQFKDKKQHAGFPLLELANGSVLSESGAIAEYLARTSTKTEDLCGKGAFEEAQVSQWMYIASTGTSPLMIKIYTNTFGMSFNSGEYETALKGLQAQASMLNLHLKQKEWLVGGRLTMADVTNFVMLIIPFGLVLDAEFREQVPHLTAWFQRMAKVEQVVKICGHVKMCTERVLPIDTTGLPQVTFTPPKP